MINFIRKNKKEIGIGLVVLIVGGIFLNPILDFLSKLFLNAGVFLFESYVNRIYKEIAVGETDYSYFLFLFLTYLFLASFGGIPIAEKIIQKFKSKKTNKKDSNELVELKENDSTLNGKKFPNKLINALAALVVFMNLILIITIHIKKVTITSFHQHLRVISPYISDEEEEIIISDFSRMESIEDYEKIRAKLDSIATENDIKLPKNKLYSF